MIACRLGEGHGSKGNGGGVGGNAEDVQFGQGAKSTTQQDIDVRKWKLLSGPWCEILPSVLMVKHEGDSHTQGAEKQEIIAVEKSRRAEFKMHSH